MIRLVYCKVKVVINYFMVKINKISFKIGMSVNSRNCLNDLLLKKRYRLNFNSSLSIDNFQE